MFLKKIAVSRYCHLSVEDKMCKDICAEIMDTQLDVHKAIDFVSDDAHGAVATFLGVVRNHHQGKSVQGISYDVHDSLAREVLESICGEGVGFWLGTKYYAAHYKGELGIGGVSVLIAVSSAHRADSFDALRYVIEEIKLRLPVWKQEHYSDGKSAWLPGNSLREDVSSVCCGKCG